METTRIYLGLKLPETSCACSPSNTTQLQVSWVEKGKERSLLRNERNTSPQNQPFVVLTVLASGPFSRREVALNPNLKGKIMHLIWGDLSLKHTRSIFLTFLSFSRSHNSLFTWTCCLFLSLSVPSSVRTEDYRGRRRAVDLMLFMWFSEAFFRSIYFFSFYLDSAVILLQNQGHVGVYWGIYISATPNTFTLIVFFISLKWPHLITVIIFACWDHRGPCDVFFNNQMLKEMLHIILNQEPNGVKSFIHSDNETLRKRTASFIQSDHRHVVVFRSSGHFSFLQKCQNLKTK